MKLSRIWQLIGLLLVTAFPAFAQVQDVQITTTKKKVDEQKSRSGGPVTVTTKEIIYLVTVQNRRFVTMPEVQVKYMIFLADAQGGSTEKAVTVSHRGSETLKNLASNASVTFETKPIKLTTEELDGGWAYASGASGRARDKVSGLWIRAYADGKIIGEYANPTSVTKKNEWKE
jgi:hypothetical protein